MRSNRECEQLLEDNNVVEVECCFADLWGSLVGRRLSVPVFLKALEEGLRFPNAPFAWTLNGMITPVPFTNLGTGYPNMFTQPDRDTLIPMPWRPGVAFCHLDTFVESGGEPMAVDPRAILRATTDRLAETGLTADVALEVEFYLCDDEWEPLYGGRRSFAISKGLEGEPTMRGVLAALGSAGISVEAWHAEYGPGQLEISLQPTDVMRAADELILLKHVVKEVARSNGVRATFMPAPFEGESHSGLHAHISLHGTESDMHLFERLASGGKSGDKGSRFLGGVLEQMPDLTAVMNPSINAYKRIADHHFAGNRVCWGYDNRTVSVRVLGTGESARLEVRTPSSDANPYLVLAGTLGAGLDGIEHDASIPDPIDGSAYEDDERAPMLPDSLRTAVDALDGSESVRRNLGATLVETFTALTRSELAAFAAHVTGWERDRYLEQS